MTMKMSDRLSVNPWLEKVDLEMFMKANTKWSFLEEKLVNFLFWGWVIGMIRLCGSGKVSPSYESLNGWEERLELMGTSAVKK